MGEMPLGSRRQQLTLNYWANPQGHGQDHPTHEVLKPCWEKERWLTKSFGWTLGRRAIELKLDQFNISQRLPLPAIPRRILATGDFTLFEKKNRDGACNLNFKRYTQ